MGCSGRCKKALVQTRTKYIKHGKNPIVAEGGRVDATNKHGEEHFADLEKQRIANINISITRRENIRSISGA